MRKPSAAQISAVMRAMGSKGGSVCGPQKARTSEQARAASRVRWDKARHNVAVMSDSPAPERTHEIRDHGRGGQG